MYNILDQKNSNTIFLFENKFICTRLVSPSNLLYYKKDNNNPINKLYDFTQLIWFEKIILNWRDKFNIEQPETF